MTPAQRVAESLNERRDALAERLTEEHFRRHPDLLQRFGDYGRRKCLEDAHYHLQYLAHALRLETPALFTAYVQWARQMLEKRNVAWSELQANLQLLREVIAEEPAAEYIDLALQVEPVEARSYLAATPREPLARAYLAALLGGGRRVAAEIVRAGAGAGASIRDLYLNVFQPVQREIGRLWQNNEISVAEEHYCTASTQAIMAQFYPEILSAPRVGRKVIVACVGNELHEMGTRMVADFFEMDGWDGIYTGANTPAHALVELVCRERPNLVALGITMAYHLDTAARLVASLRADARCADTKVIVGGYIFQQHEELWRAIGADGSAIDAEEAVELGNRLIDDSRT